MTITGDDLGVLGNLAGAIGLFDDGSPNSDWFGRPDHYLAQMLSDDDQRTALIAFVDEVLGGEDRTTAPGGTTWLPVVSLRPPDDPMHLDVCVTLDHETPSGGTPRPIRIGLGLAVQTTTPAVTRTTLEIPLFQVDGNGVTASTPFLLGQVGGRIRIGATVVVGPGVIDAIGIDLDIPTNAADTDPSFGLTLTGLQLPGAPEPRDIRVSADGADELDDAVLDLVLSLVRSLVAAPPAIPAPGGPGGPAAPTAHEVLTAVAGMLGLVPGDAIPDFPIASLVEQGPAALTAWLHSLLTDQTQRERWIDYLADLFGAEAEGSEVVFALPGTTIALRVGIRVDTGESGHAQVTPTLGMDLTQPGSTARAEARVDLCTIDLVTGAAVAVPRLGIWASLGAAADKVIDVAGPPLVRADRLRLGFALDTQRRPTFVVAADTVAIGDQEYAVLDLTSPDALMDAAGAAVGDIADDLLGDLGVAVQVLLGIGNAPGMTAPTLSVVELATDPVGKLSGHWKQLLADHRGDVALALEVLRDGLSDATTAAVDGTGTAADPWRVGLVGPLAVLLWTVEDRLVVDLVVTTSVDTLGGNAPVIEGRIGAHLAEIDLATRSASLLTGVEAQLSARLRDVTPPQARLEVGEGVALKASRAGLRFGWSAAGGLVTAVDLPELSLEIEGGDLPIALPEIAADGTVAFPAEGWDLLQQLVGHLQGYLPTVVKGVTDLLGWTGPPATESPVLRLADLVDDPGVALRDWAAALAVSELAPSALAFLADLLTATDGAAGLLAGSGHPDDPFRLDLGVGVPLPELAVWFPPLGLRPRVVNVPEEVRNWVPGDPGLEPSTLRGALELEAEVASDVAELIESRDVAGSLDQIALRWRNGDGRIVPPTGTPPGVTRVLRFDVGARQLLEELSLADELGRTPTAAVYVALGSAAWQDKPADRVVDLTAPALQPSMFTAPAPAAGDWFVRLGSRAACKVATADPDGTVGQAARLRVLLDRLATLGADVVVVGVAGAGHACREAAAGQPAVSEVVTLGTPYGPVSLVGPDRAPGGRRTAPAAPTAPSTTPTRWRARGHGPPAGARSGRLADGAVGPGVTGRRPGATGEPADRARGSGDHRHLRRCQRGTGLPRDHCRSHRRARSPGTPSSPDSAATSHRDPGRRALRAAGQSRRDGAGPRGRRTHRDRVRRRHRVRPGQGRDGTRAAGPRVGDRPARLAHGDPVRRAAQGHRRRPVPARRRRRRCRAGHWPSRPARRPRAVPVVGAAGHRPRGLLAGPGGSRAARVRRATAARSRGGRGSCRPGNAPRRGRPHR